ncbi:MAG: DUF1566 domain-containing protein [Myxococcota bacterium]|nr:DUF1566 domain-containing protein [Myxococcota bacterium]
MPNAASESLPHRASYTDVGNGTVRDNVTGLLWEKMASTPALAWPAAKTYCAGLTLAGRTWHLPTRIELISIMDYAKSGVKLDTSAFPGAPGAFHWTSSAWVVSQIASKPQDAWAINLSDGFVSNSYAQTGVLSVRCVSSSVHGAMPKLYSQAGPGEIQDTETGLVWTQASSTTSMDQPTAIAYCAGLALNGHTWRLPSIKELSTTVDETPAITKVSPAIDTTVFSDTTPNAIYMSASTHGGAPFAVTYTDGIVTPSKTAGQVRCVR